MTSTNPTSQKPQNKLSTSTVLQQSAQLLLRKSTSSKDFESVNSLVSTLEQEQDLFKQLDTFRYMCKSVILSDETLEAFTLMLCGCLARDYAYLRAYNRGLANHVKDDVAEAIHNNQLEALINALQSVDKALTTAICMP